jgi:pimeloyl-ACP methyl ester carboxylesterase
VTIGYFIHGHGPVRVIGLHGWFYDSREFQPLFPAIDTHRFSFVCLDFRGYGKSRGNGPYNIETIVRDVERLADTLLWEDFCLVGHSMGGKAALLAANLLGDRVRKLLAITPVWAGAAPFDAPVLSLFRRATEDLTSREQIIDHSTGGRLPNSWSKWLAKESAQCVDSQAFADYFESWAMADFTSRLTGMTQRVYVVAGENDGGIPAEFIKATWMANLPGAELEVIPGCGHYPMLETPLALAAIFERFLDS